MGRLFASNLAAHVRIAGVQPVCFFCVTSSAERLRHGVNKQMIHERLMKSRNLLFGPGLVFALIQSAWTQPVIISQPQNQSAISGTTAIFSVGASGTEPLSYQWRSHVNASSFTNIPFGTEAALVLTNIQPTTRRFSVVVTNSGGAVTSSPLATLTALGIISQPTNQMVDLGNPVTFAIVATSGPSLAYQWRFNGADLAGKTSDSLLLPVTQLTDAGAYSVVVSYAIGSVTSRVAVLTFTSLHRIAEITPNTDHTMALKLEGVAPRLFGPYYDLYLLDASTNLLEWSPLAVLQRTNVSLDSLSYLDSEATNFDKRFYRTPTNFLITPFPKPSGPYVVGTVSRLLTDPSRTNRNNIPTNNSFMATFWYPAGAKAGVLPEAYVESNATLYAYSNERNPGIVSQFVSHAVPELPLATNQAIYPVLIYSHGGGFRRQNTDKALELASHGYVVVAMDHEWTTASVFPSGQIIYGAGFCSNSKECFQPALESAIKDFRFVLDQLAALNSADALAGRLDLERVGAFGFSAGAVPVAEFGRVDARCKAVVLLDPGWLLEAPADLNQLGLQKPFLSMNSTMAPRPSPPPSPPYTTEWLYGTLLLFTNALDNAFWFQIQDSSHQSFQDRGSLISDPNRTADPTPVSRDQSETIRGCLVSFFDKYLKGEDNHLLDNPATVYTNIINLRRK
jgi:dienelactone hydrolase